MSCNNQGKIFWIKINYLDEDDCMQVAAFPEHMVQAIRYPASLTTGLMMPLTSEEVTIEVAELHDSTIKTITFDKVTYIEWPL